MQKLFSFLIVLSFLISCSEESISPRSKKFQETQTTEETTSTTVSETAVSGLTRFKASDLLIPSGGLPDGTRFYGDGILRASTAYNPYGVTAVKKDGIPRVRYYVNPTSPASYLTGTTYPYHYRAEFTRYPWRISHPLGTEEWLGFSYIFPTEAEGFVQNQTPVSIYQNHAGSVEGQTSNPPALQLEIAYPGQLNSSTDPYRQTPLGGEIMVINNVLKTRYVVQGVRVQPGARLDVVMQIVYGLEKEGLFNVWINGKLHTTPVTTGNIGSTVWPPVLSTDVAVGGNSKLGLYHHQMRFSNYVTLNANAGHKEMEMFMTDWNDVIRKPADPDYKNINAYEAVSTASYK
jgi:hypothetical protein